MNRVAIVALGLSLCAGSVAGDELPPASQLGETMTVARYIVEVRVTDTAGHAVTDIPAGDFDVTIGKARAHVEAAEWIGSAKVREREGSVAATEGLPAAAEPEERGDIGRNIVFFVQTDFGRNRDRIVGQMAFMANLADRVVEMLQPEDRIAVVSFDSHLKLRCDFTTDRAAALEAIRGSIAIDEPATPVRPAAGPSLFAAIDATVAKKVASSEAAFLEVARALRRVEGERLMFLVGWGFGEVSWATEYESHLVLPPAWSEAVGLLHRDHVPVITIGTSTGQLTLGIALTARATGGIHTSAVSGFPEQTLARIEGRLAGYYDLVLRIDAPLPPGEYPIVIRTKDPRHRVQATPVIVIDEVDARYGEAIALINAGAVEQGVEALRASMASPSLPTDVLVERLAAFVDAGQWQAALAVVERLEAANAVDDEVARMRDEAKRGAALRTTASAHAELTAARKLLLDGEGAKALTHLDRAVATEPKLADAWFERGMLLLSLGRTADAKTSLERCLELDPHGTNAATARDVLEGIGTE